MGHGRLSGGGGGTHCMCSMPGTRDASGCEHSPLLCSGAHCGGQSGATTALAGFILHGAEAEGMVCGEDGCCRRAVGVQSWQTAPMGPSAQSIASRVLRWALSRHELLALTLSLTVRNHY